MARTVFAVIAGYLATAIAVGVSLTLAWFVLGASFAFEPGTSRTTLGWCLVVLILGFPPAMLGGWIARKISRDSRGVIALAVLMLVLGLVSAAFQMVAEPPPAPAAEELAGLPFWEAAAQAQQPLWLSLLLPFVGAGGTLIGGGTLVGGGVGRPGGS